MANSLKLERQKTVLHTLLEGNSIRSTERLTGVHRDTICRLLVDFGRKCKDYMDSRLRGLTLRHVEVDEIWTFVYKKQGRLEVEEKAERFDIGDIYLWTCLDQDTKLVASFIVGKRSADNARKLMVDLRERLVMPGPRQSDQTGAYLKITQISTDGFAAYPEAVDLAFGPYVKYGQIIKDYRNADQPGRYAAPEMVGSERKGYSAYERTRSGQFVPHTSNATTLPSERSCSGLPGCRWGSLSSSFAHFEDVFSLFRGDSRRGVWGHRAPNFRDAARGGVLQPERLRNSIIWASDFFRGLLDTCSVRILSHQLSRRSVVSISANDGSCFLRYQGRSGN